MLKFAAILIAAFMLASCDAISTMTDGFKNAHAVESDLQGSTGVKPEVGFNWRNGRLLLVTVTFPRILEKPVTELADTVRGAVGRHFRQTPDKIVLGFALEGAATGRAAQAQ